SGYRLRLAAGEESILDPNCCRLVPHALCSVIVEILVAGAHAADIEARFWLISSRASSRSSPIEIGTNGQTSYLWLPARRVRPQAPSRSDLDGYSATRGLWSRSDQVAQGRDRTPDHSGSRGDSLCDERR